MKIVFTICLLVILTGCSDVVNNNLPVLDVGSVFKLEGSKKFVDDAGIVLEAANLPKGNEARTIKLRVKPEVLKGTIISYGKIEKNARCAISFKPNGNLFFWGWYCDAIGNIKLPLNEWSDILLTYDGKKLNLYVNDEQICSGNLELETAESDSIVIGKGFKGEISGVNILNGIEKTENSIE